MPDRRRVAKNRPAPADGGRQPAPEISPARSVDPPVARVTSLTDARVTRLTDQLEGAG